MKIIDINPHIRFAAELQYNSHGYFVRVKDCRMFYVLSGECEISIDENKYTLNKDSLFYCSAGSRYSIVTKNTVSLISLNFDLSQNYSADTTPYAPIKDVEDIGCIFYDNINDSEFLNSHIFIKDGEIFIKMLKEILSEFSGKTKFFREISASLLKQIITQMHRYGQQTNPTTSAPVTQAIEYIEKNLTKNITNKEIAKNIGYHEYYLNRIFISNTGMSMHQYILNRRMSKAQHLILNTDMPLKDISTMVGFNNYTHFSDYFKKYFELSPSSYKNHMKNKI